MTLDRVTATLVLRDAMEARARNLAEADLIYNPSPELDSLGELPAELLRAGAPADLVAQMITLCRQILAHNIAEGDCEMRVAGLMETEIARNRALPALERVTAKAIAARLRGPLAVLADPAAHDAIEFFRASCAVRDVIRAVPRAQLLTLAVAHHLGGRKHRLLTTLADMEETP